MTKLNDGQDFLWFEGKMAINADGCPRAYGPPGTKPLDYLANAGSPGKWWGIVTDANGEPIVQGKGDPYPGMYISTTSLVDKGYPRTNPRRYCDSESINFLVIPRNAPADHGIKLGDVGLAYNKATGLWAAGVVADIGPKGKWGEGSIALGKAIGVKNVSPKNGGVSGGIVWVFFKNSSKGWPRVPAEMNDQVNELLNKHGGLDQFIK